MSSYVIDREDSLNDDNVIYIRQGIKTDGFYFSESNLDSINSNWSPLYLEKTNSIFSFKRLWRW